MSDVSKWNVISKTSLTSAHYIPVTGKSRLQVSSLLPTLAAAGSGSISIYTGVTNGNQLNFKGIKSGDTGLLTAASVTSDSEGTNVVLTVLEAGIDLNSCDNTTAQFLKTVALASNVTGQLSVVNGGTGLSTISKGAMLYASADSTIAATSAMNTNGQVLIGNATSGIPTLATLTAGSNITITNGAGSISIEADLTSAGAPLDMNTHNINLDRAAGESWVSGDGADEGITVDASGKVTIGDSTPTTTTAGAQLSLQGTTGTAIEIGNTNTYKDYTVNVKTAAGGVNGAALNIEGAGTTSGNTSGGNISVIAGTGNGSGNGGTTAIKGGAGGASGAGGTIKFQTYSGSGSGSLGTALELDNNQNVLISGGFLRLSQTPQTLTGAGAVDITSAITWIVTTGTNALTLADGVEGQTKMIVMKTDGGDGTLTPANFAQGTSIAFDAVGDSVSLLFTNAAWHVMGGRGYAIA